MDNNITVIVPIYRLISNRFNNFCYLVKILNKLECDVIVVEQESDKTLVTEQYLLNYANIKHLVQTSNTKTFNKSRIINYAARDIFTEFLWVVDGDFYTDFEYILKNMDTSSDFIRPFSEVVFLSKSETYVLHSSNVSELKNETEYKSNSQNGKFSFIVRNSTFIDAGGMNEDYEGWGFQDLDFVENRLQSGVEFSSVDKRGFHMYHAPASRENVNINRQLYTNYNRANINKLISKKIKEYSGKQKYVLDKENVYLKKTKYTETKSEQKPTAEVKTRIIKKWPEPKYGVVYSSDSRVFYPGLDVITVRDAMSHKLKNINGTFSRVAQTRHFLYYYYEYICHIYEVLPENKTVLFANDTFCTNFSEVNDLNAKIQKVKSSQLLDIEDHGYTSLYKEFKHSLSDRPFSKLGCFVVNSSKILNRKFDSYYTTLLKMKSWSDMEFKEHIPKFKKFLFDNQ